MSEIEVYRIDLDEEILSHLTIPESISVFQDEEVSTRLIEDDFIKGVYEWQINHIHEHHRPATASVLADEFDLDFSEPLTTPGDLVGRLRERYIRNNARSHMEKISKAYEEDPAKVIDVLPRVAREIVDIAGPRVESYGSGDYERAIQKYNEAVVKPIGPGFGFREIDAHFHAQRGIGFLIGASRPYGRNLGIRQQTHGQIESPLRRTDTATRWPPRWTYQGVPSSGIEGSLLRRPSSYRLASLDGWQTCRWYLRDYGSLGKRRIQRRFLHPDIQVPIR